MRFATSKPLICLRCNGFITVDLDGWQCINCGAVYYRNQPPDISHLKRIQTIGGSSWRS